MHVRAAQILGGDLLAGCRLHQWRASQKDRAIAAHDHRLVAHRRDVGAARRTGPHDGRDLRDALGRHLRLVVEDAAKVLAVGEDIGLKWQKRAAGIHQVDAGQAVLLGDLLRAQMLLDGHREVGPTLDCRVIGDDDALLPLDDADAGHDARRGRLVVVHAVRRQRIDLQKRRLWIAEQLDPLAGQQLLAGAMLGDGALAAALARMFGAQA